MGRPRKVVQPVAAESNKEAGQAQVMANRIWNGQSVSLSRKERIRRINVALVGHGFLAEEIEAVEFQE